MESQIIFAAGTLISVWINTALLFQFIEERNTRVYSNKYMYIVARVAVCMLLVVVNLFSEPISNITSWIISYSLITVRLYKNFNKTMVHRIFEVIILILILAVCETVGVIILDVIVWGLGIHDVESALVDSMEITFSKLVVLLFYYLVIQKIWREDKTVKFTLKQCLVQAIIIMYSVVNLALILSVVSKITSSSERIMLVINMGCILFTDFYLLYYTKCVEENNQLKVKLRLLEQQSVLQYEYYVAQEDKYNESFRILHDVNKHVKMIESMYQAQENQMAITYTHEITQMLEPLALKPYTNNPILNILLNDKKKYAMIHNIKFTLEVGEVELDFMEPIEVTTVFGNLLDNAIEACERVTTNKFITMKLDQYKDFIAINITNSTVPIEKWQLGRPISKKGKNHGIGLINVENAVKKYNGNIILEEQDRKFSCNVIFNK